MTTLLNKKIIELFDFKGRLLSKKQQTDVKEIIMPYFSEIERNFSFLFNNEEIDENIISSDLFQNTYIVICQRFNTEEIKNILSLLRSCRNLFCHYIGRTMKQKKAYNFQYDSKLSDLCFFENGSLQIDGSLTLHGLFVIMVLFMNNTQIHNFFDTLAKLPHINSGACFYRQEEGLSITKEENALRIRNELKSKFKDCCHIEIPHNLYMDNFMFHILIPQISKFLLAFEQFCYDYWHLGLKDFYSTFKEVFEFIPIDSGLAEKVIKCRNRVAHGRYYVETDGDIDSLANEYIDLLELLIKEYKTNDNICNFLNTIIDEFKTSYFRFKYKRVIELAIKIKLALGIEEPKTPERIKKISKFPFVFNCVDICHEKKLFDISSIHSVKFDFEHKIPQCKYIILSEINVYNYENSNVAYYLYDGHKIDGNQCLGVSFEQFELPNIVAYDNEDQIVENSIVKRSIHTGFMNYYDIS